MDSEHQRNGVEDTTDVMVSNVRAEGECAGAFSWGFANEDKSYGETRSDFL